MIKKETILSVFDKKLTLLQYLKEIKSAIEDSIVESFSCDQIDATHVKFSLDFADGTKYETDVIEVPQGPQGEKGDTGATPNISVSVSAETLEPNESATASVEQGGTPSAPTIAIAFGIPKGEQGEGSKMYLHCISETSVYGVWYLYLTLNESQPFTNAILAKWLNDNGFISASNPCAVNSKWFVYSSKIAKYNGIISANGTSLTKHAQINNGTSLSTENFAVGSPITDVVIEL